MKQHIVLENSGAYKHGNTIPVDNKDVKMHDVCFSIYSVPVYFCDNCSLIFN